ncbi:MAG: BsuPI-related putative proteinase inhibitor [Pseudomonadota bacterium]
MKSHEKTFGRMMARVALLVGIGLFTAGAQYSCNSNGVGSVNNGNNGPIFQSTLTLRNVAGVETSSFVLGEPIRFDFEIANLTNRQQRLQFPDAQTHEFLVVNNGTPQIRWMWSDGQAFAQVNTELMFESYASKTFTLIWPATLTGGTQLPVGSYQARGSLEFDGFKTNPLAPNEQASALEAFTVR